jgi:hypothetical protein
MDSMEGPEFTTQALMTQLGCGCALACSEFGGKAALAVKVHCRDDLRLLERCRRADAVKATAPVRRRSAGLFVRHKDEDPTTRRHPGDR